MGSNSYRLVRVKEQIFIGNRMGCFSTKIIRIISALCKAYITENVTNHSESGAKENKRLNPFSPRSNKSFWTVNYGYLRNAESRKSKAVFPEGEPTVAYPIPDGKS